MITRVSVCISIVIGLVAILGDFIQSHLVKRWQLAVIDNLTHVLVAFFTWSTISFSPYGAVSTTVIEAIVCGLIASLIDTDHFIAASSLRLMDATNLKTRPFLHNSTLIILIFVLSITLSCICGLPLFWNLSWIFLAAGLSHHIRDATRRGFLFSPIGSTPPIPYVSYVFLQVIFPHIIKELMKLTVKPRYEILHIEMV